MALLTVMGLYNYDNTIFDNLMLPDGVDKPTLVDNIILETAELECIYPTPVFLKTAIGLWSNVQFLTWDRVYSAMNLEYNPIENYDRQETETTTGTRAHSGKDTTVRSGSTAHTGKDTTTHSGTVSETGSTTGSSQGSASESGTTTNKIAGFDSTTLVDHDSSTGSNTRQSSDSTTGSNTRSGTDSATDELTHGETVTNSATDELTHGEQIADSGSRTSRIRGNIGVTTSQMMLQSELDIAPNLNIYKYITADFRKRFCIEVY